MDLPTEKFNAVKELAEVHMEIASGRAALTKLKDETKSYLELREQSAHDHILKVLEASTEALESTKANHAELASYASGLRALALELNGFSSDLVALSNDFRNRTIETNAKLDVRLTDIQTREKEVTIERVKLAGDREQLDRDLLALREGKRILADRTQLLQKQSEYIKNLQSKK